jgi:hypothetical protein
VSHMNCAVSLKRDILKVVMSSYGNETVIFIGWYLKKDLTEAAT